MLTIHTPNQALIGDHVNEWQGEGIVSYNGTQQEISNLPFSAAGHRGDILTFATILHETDPENNALMFRSLHQKVRAYLDGELVLEYGYSNQVMYGKTPGNLWHIIPLPADGYEGMELRIELETIYDSYGVSMEQLYIGEKSDLIFMPLKQARGVLLISIPVFFMGLFMVAIGILSKSRAAARKLVYLGLYAAMAGAWMLLEGRMIQFFSGRPLLFMQLIFILFSLSPVVLIRFLLTFRVCAESRYMRFVFVVSICNFLATHLLQLLNLADYMDTAYSTHLVFALLILGDFIVTFQDWKKHRAYQESEILLAGMLFAGFGLIDIIRFYLPAGKSDALRFTRIGTLVFVTILGYSAVKQILQGRKDAIEEKALRKLAYTDMMTGLLNRTAFEEKMEELRSSKEKPVITIVDVNRLKYINDNYGHKSGDDAICRAGNILSEAFGGEAGKVYRIGGDEFCVLSFAEINTVEKLLETARKEFERQNEKTPYPFAAAIGYVQVGENGIDQAFSEADHRMYQDKSRLKKECKLAGRPNEENIDDR